MKSPSRPIRAGFVCACTLALALAAATPLAAQGAPLDTAGVFTVMIG